MKIFQQTRKALGSDATITIVTTSLKKAEPAFTAAWEAVEGFENKYSRFKPESELSILNLQPGTAQPVTDEFARLLQAALYYQKLTDGLFTPFILPALQKAGYKGSWPAPHVFEKSLDFEDRQIGTTIELSDTTVKLPDNTAIDLGGIGKGYLLDLLADILLKLKIRNFWISLGGDIIAEGTDPDRKPWIIDIEAADGSGAVIATHSNKGVRLAVATSGTVKRKGEDWHHIIDPRTGKSSDSDIIMASVASFSATEADIFAKCLIILGSKDCEAFLVQHEINSAVVQTEQDNIVFGNRELANA